MKAEPDGPAEAAQEGPLWPAALFLLAFLALMTAAVAASFWLFGKYAAVGWGVLVAVVTIYDFRDRSRKRREALEELGKLPIAVQRRIMTDVFFGLGGKDRR